MKTILKVSDLTKSFPTTRNFIGRVSAWHHAVQNVDFTLDEGETLGIVGESGAGKSTLGRLVLRLIKPDSGVVEVDGTDLLRLNRQELVKMRARARMVFQDPFSSMDPKMSVENAVAEPLKIHLSELGRSARQQRIKELFDRVGLRADHMDRYPQELSGGQLQRVAIARAISTNPDFVVCDEPVAALDTSIRAQVIELMREIQNERGISYIFISHDLSLVRLIAHRTAVMYNGRIVESGPTSSLFTKPRHPYTQRLLSAIPVPDPRQRRPRFVPVRPDESGVLPSGCEYAPRCPLVIDRCRVEAPAATAIPGGGYVYCHRAFENETAELLPAVPVRRA